ncbi:MAG: coenzyme F420-0:L-glutamate ligase [Solirubrobacteraceae bacterium]|nr:coenzyme F420-0:L-glutamate ligase [Solirubrobacteraceae bacterium]
MSRIEAVALDPLPEVAAGDDLASLLLAAAGGDVGDGDVLVVAHKVVSKAEGAVVDLDSIEPGERALQLAADQGKDARHIQVVLDQSAEIMRAERGVLICRTHHGFVCANAGVDASNAGRAERLVTLPRDPDASARALRAVLPGRPAVVISDSFGRAWRHGQVDVAVGVAGLAPLEDWRGRHDAWGRELHATWIAIADQAAGAADLVRGKDSRVPAVRIRGLERFVTADDGPGAQALLRGRDEDLFT